MKSKVLIIAEAGVNHNGDLNVALQLVRAAAATGADIVKFQTFKAEALASSRAGMADYQKKNLNEHQQTQQQMLKKLELKYDDHMVLIDECRKLGIKFLSTAFDFESLRFLKSLDLGLWKIPSGEITNLPYLEFVAGLNQDVILSTGMSDMSEVNAAVSVLLKNGQAKAKLSVLHCNTDYPTQMSDVNLNAMAAMGRDLGLNFGYSDHTMGIEVPIAAVALGAVIIEKHFTLDRSLPGPDQLASLEPEEFTQMVKAIRNIEMALGQSKKIPSASELKNRDVARKSIVAAKKIKNGEVFSLENLTVKRPGSGVSPMQWHSVLGTKATRDYEEDELI